MMSTLSLSLFGRFRARYNGEPLTRFGSNKVQALLIYLTVTEALNDEQDTLRHRREAVMELLWPGLLPQSAQNNLRQTIYKLRQLLPALDDANGRPQEFIISARLTVQLNPQASYEIDVANFQHHLVQTQSHDHDSLHSCLACQSHLQQAVALYQGEFLADFFLEDSNEFEEWAWNLRALHRRQVLDALDTLTLMMLRQGQHNQARAYTEQQLTIDPLRESAYRQLMEILAISGQPSEALAQYERLCQLLQDEMGMEPMAQTTAVYDQIRAGELGVAVPSATAVRGYDLQEEIGTGAFGIVYRARQPHVNRDVAVKIIAPDLANQPDFIRRFEVEAQLVARLEHPHIVPLYDYWREPDAAYLVMRYLRGGSLEQQLGQGALPAARAERILEQVCSALQVAHQQQIVHRDIKPANILLDESGNAYLSDFGIAKEMGSQRHLTEVGALVGTPDFISPEQFSNEPISPASDMYSLGIVLFQMLTGRLPFPEASLSELIYKHLHEQIPSVHCLRPELPPAVDEVIWQATAKEAQARFPTTTALAHAFQAAMQQETTRDELFVATIAPSLEVSNPYKGLRSFQEADSDDFYGREALVHQLVTRLTPTPALHLEGGGSQGEGRFLAVVGPSGSGKSSVVKAGLIPALRRGDIPGSENWFVVEMVPGTHPLEELEAALLHVAVNPPPSLLEPLQKDARGLIRTLKRVLPPMTGDERPQLLLVIDQFEELFTLVKDKVVRQHFLDSLLTALADSRSQLRLVITLRADFYDRPLQLPELGEMLRQYTEVVLPLTLAELEQAITRPAARMGVRFEAGLATRIAADVADQPGTLPLLQYALTELFEQRQDGLLPTAAYEAIGGVGGALGRRADEIYEGLAPAERVVARQLFLRLVTLGEGVEDTRRRVLRSELRDLETPGVYEAEPVVEKVVAEYGRFRLLTFDRDPLTRAPTVEVAHEALLREWGRLRGWLNQNRDDVRQQRRLAQATAEWQQVEQDAGYLLRGTRLDQFAGWAAETQLALTGDERAFLEASLAARASRQAEEEARRQRELETAKQLAETERQRAGEQAQAALTLRRRAVYLAVVALVAIMLAVVAGLFSQQAAKNEAAAVAEGQRADDQREAALSAQATAEANLIEANALRLAAEANNLLLLNGDPELVALLSIRSVSKHYSPPGDAALVGAAFLGPPPRQFKGHLPDHNIWGVAISPDGKYLATSSGDQTARLWDIASTQTIHVFSGHTAEVYSIAFSPDGKHIVTASDDGTAIIWDIANGQMIKILSGHTAGLSWAEFSPDGKLIATAGWDNTARIWDVDTGEVVHVLGGHSAPLAALKFSPDGKYVLTGSWDDTARLWDVSTGNEVRVFSGHTSYIISVAYSPDGRYIATGSWDQTAKLWDAASGEIIHDFSNHQGSITSVTFSPDGRFLVTGGDDRIIRVRDIASGRTVRTIGNVDIVQSMAVSADGNLLATTSGTGIVRVWQLQSGSGEVQFVGHAARLLSGAFSPDGKYVLTSSDDGTARMWERATGKELMQFVGHSDPVRSAIFSPDGKSILTTGWDQTARLWDASTGQQLHLFDGHSDVVDHAAFSPDGNYFVTVSWDGTARVWDIHTAETIITYTDQDSPINTVAYSPDGRAVATGSDDGTIHLWDPLTGQESRVLTGFTDIVGGVAFSSNGKQLAAASWDGNVRIWDVTSGMEIHRFTAHQNIAVYDIAFSPDDVYLVTASSDGTAHLWDLATGTEVRRFMGHTDSIRSVVFSPDGKYILTASRDSTARLWHTDYHDTIHYVCSLLTRDFTAEERTQYGILDDEPTCPEP